MDGWVEREMEACRFPDERLKKRFGELLARLGGQIGSALPVACQDWAATKAAYRFFDNRRFDEHAGRNKGDANNFVHKR